MHIRFGMLFALFVGLGSAVGAPAGGAESGGLCEVRTGPFTIVCDRARGGLVASVRSSQTGAVLMSGMNIYTDFGLYGSARGYVGTRQAPATEFECRRKGDAVEIRASGTLHGEPASGRPPTAYRFEVEFRPEGRMRLRVGVNPGVEKSPERSAFLALHWTVPGLTEFTARTAKGVIRRRYLSADDRRRRAWAARSLPMDPRRPEFECITSSGWRVRLRGIRSEGDIPAVGPVIHGESLFLCWLDGPGNEIHPGKWSWITCEIEFVPPENTRR